MPKSAPGSEPARHLIIPFAGRGTPGCRAIIAELRLPRLERLMTRMQPLQDDMQEETTFSPPHERALAAALGLPVQDGRIPWAALQARQLGLPEAPAGHGWGRLDLCHWHVGIDDVALGDPRTLTVDAAESATLLALLTPFFAEDGIALHAGGHPGQWLASGALFDTLATASVDRAAGQPISEWSPLADAGRPLRRLQNETQMLLYTNPLNDARAERGLPPINSFWASGTGALPTVVRPVDPAPETDERLRMPALLDDAPGWAMAWRSLDEDVVAPLLAALESGADVRLTLCGDRIARTFGPRTGGGIGALARRLFERAPAPVDVLGAL
ncbi:hypothetical protein QTH91_02905 [Variovorax dokdonensis]|uniref:Phosphoglycerate mutase n=1 Tax=Variovorax dokdonensis TaxID=344883 RepID=A0ABT7N646_9BURK|nr:hypothetical protein [Variovorax dokdonensis]MDM0043419.1 hypothetical protein [Variovorax dokdonensis]